MIAARAGRARQRPVSPMRAFDPRAVGSFECRAWETYYRREWGAFLVASVRMVRAAFRAGITMETFTRGAPDLRRPAASVATTVSTPSPRRPARWAVCNDDGYGWKRRTSRPVSYHLHQVRPGHTHCSNPAPIVQNAVQSSSTTATASVLLSDHEVVSEDESKRVAPTEGLAVQRYNQMKPASAFAPSLDTANFGVRERQQQPVPITGDCPISTLCS